MSDPAYWQESFECALDGLSLFHLVEQMTPEQRAEVGKSLATSAECYSDCHYTPENPMIRENERLTSKLSWERALVGCNKCGGVGRLSYSTGPWAVNTGCHVCHGAGKVHPHGEREPA